MRETIINASTKAWVNSIALPDDWTGANGEWQIPEGHELVDGNGSIGFIWDGTQFVDPNRITEAEQTAIVWALLRTERNALLVLSDWTQGNDSPLDDEAKVGWAEYRQELRDLPASTENPDEITWPEAPE